MIIVSDTSHKHSKMFIATVPFTNLLISFFSQMIYGASDGPEVVTSVGTIRGVRATNGNYSMFLGIPFAKVNESNPFGPALRHPYFEKVFEANNDDKSCPRTDGSGALDCLIANIYVPDSVCPDKPLPVMIYIFGGRFNAGTPNDYTLGPKFFMEHEVILVKINYRLGPYGFMCLHTPEVPGNEGLRDQSLGMRWVKEHIADFGGDPDKITIFGNSAGAISVDYHVLSEEEPVYHNVIIQSGTAFNLLLKGADPDALLKITEYLGLKTTDYIEAIEFLSKIESNKVVQAYMDTGVYFGPCIEKKIEGVQRMISDNSVNLSAPKAKDLKVMIGSTDDELLYTLTFEEERFPTLLNFFRDILQSKFSFENETLVEAEKLVRNFYMGGKNLTADVRFALSDFDSDIEFIYNTKRTIYQYLQSGAELYYYFFTYVGRRNFLQFQLQLPPIGNWRGAYHADELGYLFDLGYVTDEPTPGDQLIMDRILKLWTNFVKYGNPTPEATDLLPIKWEPITQGSEYNYLNITTDINIAQNPLHQRMLFWDSFYEKYGQYERARLVVS